MTLPAGCAARLLALALACAAVLPASAFAQTGSTEALARAATLRDAGQFAAAAGLLEDELRRSPRDAAVLRMLAQTLYWMHRTDDALARYDAALAAAPDDVGVRLEYARTLVELRHERRARAVLQPLLARDEPEATFLLGLDAYWRGDFAAARLAFRETLAALPAHAEASRLLAEIRGAAAPWLRLEPNGQHDSQELDRTGFEADAGFFLTPLHSLVLDGSARRFAWADSSATVTVARVSTRRHFARVGLTASLALGAAHWSGADTASLVGRASLALRLAPRVELTAAAERTPYLATPSSLSSPLAADRAELRLAVERSRAHGEAAALIERFPDGNRVRTAYAWALTPLLRGAGGELKVGYALALQDAIEDRAVAVRSGTSPAGSPVFDVRYVPYHTPQSLVAHSIAAAANVRAASAVSLALNASWAFFAREDAAVFSADAAGGELPVRSTYRRAFHPLELRAALNAALSPRTTAYVEAKHARTAFYDATRAHAGLLFRFLPRSP